jgi:hypothetical protein
MSWAALITWAITAGGGLVLFGTWLKHGGMQQRERGRIGPTLILAHAQLAAAGVVIWIVYLAVDKRALAWIAFVLLLAVAILGFTMFGTWASGRRRPSDQPAAEHRFPVPIVGLHGLLAATTLVLVFLTAVGVGGS